MPLVAVLVFLLTCVSKIAGAQALDSTTTNDTGYVVIGNIHVRGNKKTKEYIILRELNLHKGDTIWNRQRKSVLELNRNRIFNTGLFITVDLNIFPTDPVLNQPANVLVIHVKERFYTYPAPIFELADRNFNEWWQQRGHDLRRTNIGIFLTQKNVRGRNETFRLKLQGGFIRKYEMTYIIPYINRRQRWGFTYVISDIRLRQIAYRTDHHKLSYTEVGHTSGNRFTTSFTFAYRKKFYQTHNFTAGFFYNTIGDSIAILNPNYFLQGRTRQRYFSLKYAFIHDRRDIRYYPLKGSTIRLEAEKLGLGLNDDINQVNFRIDFSKYFPLGGKWFLASGIRQKISFPYRQPYLNFRSLGYLQDYVSGYELYVIDGQHFSLAKVNLKYQLFRVQKQVESDYLKQFTTIPFAIYLKVYTDAGYVRDNTHNPLNSRLSNTLLLGSGAGIDIVTYYDLVLRLEYSVNRLKQYGFFLHMQAPI